MKESMKDRRKFSRAPLSLIVKYQNAEGKEVEAFVEAFTVTIGGGGLFIETFAPLSVHQEISIEIYLPGSTGKTMLKGIVVWSRTEYAEGFSPGMGIRFTRVSRQDQAKINELVTRVLVGGAEEGL